MDNEVKQEASGVERYKVPDDYVGVVRHKGYGHVEVVTAADHDRIVAERDETIAELRAEVADRKFDTDALFRRADVAEAKCAVTRDLQAERKTLETDIYKSMGVPPDVFQGKKPTDK